jgi:hypothetical protein
VVDFGFFEDFAEFEFVGGCEVDDVDFANFEEAETRGEYGRR